MPSSILVIGIGNDYRSDDGAGLAVARAIQAQNVPWITCRECDGDGTTLLEMWAGARVVILIDATSSGAPLGTIHLFDTLAPSLPTIDLTTFLSSHAFGVGEGLRLAQTFHQLPEHLMIYGIEGKTFIAGTTLSPEVTRAVQEVATCIVSEPRKIFLKN